MKKINTLEELISLAEKNLHLLKLESYIFNIELQLPVVQNVNDYNGNIIRKRIVFGGELRLINCEFNDGVNISRTGHNVYIDKSKFKNNLRLENNDKALTFTKCKFLNESTLDGSDSEFKGKIRFRECEFHGEVNFRNSTFNDLLDFWRSTFVRRVIFYKTDFYKAVVFSACTFKNNVLFTYSLIDNVALFRGTNFSKGLDLSLSILSGKLGLFGIKLDDFETVNIANKSIQNKDKSYEQLYEEAISEIGDIPIINKRETFRILKKHHESDNNIVESLPFKVLEKETLWKEIYFDLINRKNLLQNGANMIILFFNWISNRFGIAFVQSIFFTSVIGLLFFVLSIDSTSNFSFTLDYEKWAFDEGIKHFFTFMNPTHSISYLENENPSGLFYLWDFLGRIFVGYGYYQTIQAFRKFR